MSKQIWLLCFLFFSIGCHKVASKPAQAEQVKLNSQMFSKDPKPCPGTAAKVRETCGCNPVDNSLITVVEALQINETIKTRVQSCAQGKFGVDITSAVIAKGDFQSCVTKNTDVPPEVLTQLMSAIDQAVQDNERHQQELKSWLTCYEIQTGVFAEKKANPSQFSVGNEPDKKPTSAPVQGTEIKDCDPKDLEACQRACDADKPKSCNSLGIMLKKAGPNQDFVKAAAAYQRGCDKGEPDACNELAVLHHFGNGVPLDFVKAFSLYQKACDSGNAAGCSNVALSYHLARGTIRDDKKAVEFYQIACDAQHTPACNSLGDMYKNGDGIPRDEAKAIKLYSAGCDLKSGISCDKLGELYTAQKEYLRAIGIYQKSCETNKKMTSCTRLGDMYINGKGIQADTTKGMAFYQQACDANELQACVNLGRMYAFGVGVTQSEGKARKLYQKACDGNNYVGCADLGRSYFNARGAPLDGEAAFEPLQKACTNKIGQGCYDLATLYFYGVGAEKDTLKASTLFQDYCDLKHYQACILLGSWYETGQNGLSQDISVAVKFYQKGIDAKDLTSFFAMASMRLNPTSAGKDVPKGLSLYQKICDEMSGIPGGTSGCILLGNLYMTGDQTLGVAQDVPRALNLFQKGCDFKDTYCCASLGGLYTLGQYGIAKDPQKSVDFYQKACDLKDGRSCHALGLLYFNGTEIPKDTARAMPLFGKACELGNKESCAAPYKQ
jgi:TPR repeat protein